MSILGVDGNFFIHKAFYTQSYESVDPASAIARKFVSMVCNDAITAKAKKLLIAFDGNRVFRYDLYPEYKGHRHKNGPSPYDYMGGLLEYLAYCGLPALQISKYEADDILCSLATANDNVTVSTTDKDAYQYLRIGVRMLDGSAKPEPKFKYHTDVEKVFGVPPNLCLDLQTLIGDKGDAVPTLVPRAYSIKGLTKWGSLREWLANDDELKSRLKNKNLRLNRKLVKLVSDIKTEPRVPEWNHSPEMTAAYKRFLQFSCPRSKGLF